MQKRLGRRDMISSVPAAALLGAAGMAWGQAEQPPARRPGASMIDKMLAESYQENQYALPALPYPEDALEPFLDANTVHLHHQVHHQNYVNGLNRTIRQLHEMTVGGSEIDNNQLAALQRDLSFNAAGHFLHTIYWATMGSGQSEPVGDVAGVLSSQFGSLDAFRKYFSKVAVTVKGSGWAVLMYEPVSNRLFACAVHDHDVYLVPGAQPLLPLDVWEHAYYLKYGASRAEYVRSWWNVVNWSAVNAAYTRVRSARQEAAMMTSGR